MSCNLHRMKYINFECIAHTSASISVPLSIPDYELAALETAWIYGCQWKDRAVEQHDVVNLGLSFCQWFPSGGCDGR